MSISIDALSAVHRASQVYYEQLCERTTLSCGIAFYSHTYAALPWANQMREVIIPAGRTMEDAVLEVDTYFRGESLTCQRWVPAATQAPEPIEAALTPRGFIPERRHTMLLARSTDLAPEPDVRILPGRAMRRAYAELLEREAQHAPDFRAALVAAHLDRLDDPQYDLFLAQRGGRAVGRGALFQVGDIARIENLHVEPEARGQGVGRTLMAHLIAMARRLAIRLTCLEYAGENPHHAAFYESCGFEHGPSYVQFRLPPRPGYPA